MCGYIYMFKLHSCMAQYSTFAFAVKHDGRCNNASVMTG